MGPAADISLVADRVASLARPAVAEVLEQAQRLEKAGLQLTYLIRGEPDQNTPRHIAQAAANALQAGKTHYSPPAGIPELRAAVARRYARDFGMAVDPEAEVAITTGATMGLFIAIHAVVNPGDEVLLLEPMYDPYPTIVRMAGGVPVNLPARTENGDFRVPKEAIERAITKRSRAIVINNPWNPTGTVLTAAELRFLAEVAEQYKLTLIVDEIYEKIVFDGHTHHCLAALTPEARDRTITVNSFSKTYAMTGWRLGYNIASARHTRAMLRLAEQFSRSATTFLQYAGCTALNGSQAEVEAMVDTYARRRALLGQRLSAAGLTSAHLPQGTFFVFLDVRQFGMDSVSTVRYLMENARVVTMPGSAYGAAGEGSIRISFSYNEETLRRGIDQILAALERI